MTGLPACVIVFGASGFIGRNLVEALSGRIERLIAVTHRGTDVPVCSQTLPLAALDDLASLPVDTVAVHLAAARYDAGRFALAQSEIYAQNTALNARVFDFCSARSITEMRLMSSAAVYGAACRLLDDRLPLDLNVPPHVGEAFYAWSKRQAEIAAALYGAHHGINTVTFRLANPFGPYDSLDPVRAHVAPAFVMKALSDAPTFDIRGDARVERDFIYAGDVVRALIETLEWRGRSDVFNLGTGESVSLRALAEAVMRVAGREKPIAAGAPGAIGPAARPMSAEKIKAALDFRFTALEDGLKPTIDWYRDALRV